MENKELEKAILTIKNHCKNHTCSVCEISKLCIDNDIFPKE